MLSILEQYGVGPKALRLLHRFWETQQIVVKQSGYYGKPFQASLGVTQGDVISPTIFNVVVDAVVWCWLSTVLDRCEGDTGGLGVSIMEHLSVFYTDDGLMGGRDAEWLQMAVEHLLELFRHMGLRMNTDKTKAMVCMLGYISGLMASPLCTNGGGKAPVHHTGNNNAAAFCAQNVTRTWLQGPWASTCEYNMVWPQTAVLDGSTPSGVSQLHIG